MYAIGDVVQRCNLPNGSPPAYRFRGTVCGTYTNPATGEHGYVVSNEYEPGCIQIFPAKMLERVNHIPDAGEKVELTRGDRILIGGVTREVIIEYQSPDGLRLDVTLPPGAPEPRGFDCSNPTRGAGCENEILP